MNDLKELRQIVLERLETLAEVRLKKVPWDKVSQMELSDVLRAIYLDGARDAMDYLGMISEGIQE